MISTPYLIRISLLAVAAGCLSLFGQVTNSTPVIEASGLKMTKAEFEELAAGQESYRMDAAQPTSRKALGVEFGKAFALEAEARRRKMDQDPKIKLRMRAYAQQLLAAELLEQVREEYLKNEPTLKAIYEQKKQSYAQPRVRQILVRTKGSPLALRPGSRELSVEEARAKAAELRGRIAGGADFAKLAKEESDDFGSKEKGGDMGFVKRGVSGANFEDAAFRLPVGQLSDVIQTEFGFHIIRVEERQPLPFDAVRKVLANELAHQDLDAIILSGYKLNEQYFGK
ncbi:MAG: peptidylprolyl isomerase [Candidatus Solibacter sp.]|nr:peptidylprolyl isomerase [Candidatus Solibacter sp.]